jgi:hypothetical protein
MPIKRIFKNNGLATVMFAIFAGSIIGMSLTGWAHENNELSAHGRQSQSYSQYIGSGNFAEAVFENWESEFLQMWALVILTVFLYQKGSSDSKSLRGKAPQDTSSRLSIVRAGGWKKRRRAIGHTLYAHSLGLALLSLLIISFLLHAAGGTNAYNETVMQHGGASVTMIEYMGSPQFWFESLQNWQSEFLAVGSLLVLSIYLRERGSQQSKPVGRRYDKKTGE